MIGLFSKTKTLRAEAARLEAFLSAMPGSYCGWSARGEMAFSEDFPSVFGLKALRDEGDLFQALTAQDAAAFEAAFNGLRKKGADFSLDVQTLDKKRILRLRGKRGRNQDRIVSYDVIWAEDVTDQMLEKQDLNEARERAESSEDFLKTILDTLTVPVWLHGPSGRLQWVNRFYAETLGMTRERVLDNQKLIPFGQKKPQEEGETVPELLPLDILGKHCLEQGESQTQEQYIVIDGQRRLYKSYIKPVEGRQLAIGFAYDVSSREKAEQDFRIYRTNTRILLQKLQTGVATISEEGNLVFYNDEFARVWGLEDQWLNTRPPLGEIMETLRNQRKLPEQADFRAFKKSWLDRVTGLLDTEEEMLHLPDNRTLRMITIPNRLGGVIMTFEDVTSTLELESSYQTLMAVRRETLDSLAEGVSVFGGDGRLKLWNPNFIKIWGLNPEVLEGEPHISQLIERMKYKLQEEERDNHKSLITSFALERGEHEEEITLADETILSIYTVPLPDGGVMIAYDDITDTVMVEKALREKNFALEEAERLKLDFLANVSYQLRTPLNAIMGFSEILNNQYFGALNERQGEYAGGIHEAGQRLLTLIDDILDLSTIEAGYLELNPDQVHVGQMLNNLYDLTQEWARKQRIEVRLVCPKNIGAIEADERRLKQALLNLIRNAITFTPEGGEITIRGKRGKDKLVYLSVEDTGSGIPEEELKKVFEPFVKGKGGKAANQGAGLGLSLVKNISELHNGHVEIESEVGKGTIITVVLPADMKPL